MKQKRSRISGPCLQTLLERCRQKTFPEGLERAAEDNVFQLVATVSSQEEPVQPLLRAALRPSRGSQQCIRHDYREQKDDCVYDMYYLEMATPGWIVNILSVQPYSQEWELMCR